VTRDARRATRHAASLAGIWFWNHSSFCVTLARPRQCGAAVDVDCVVSAAPCLEPADPAGFVIDEAEVVFWGVCASCRADGDNDDREDWE
jgi:Fe2+ or Zn2+ uptake regulation protein